MSTLCLLYLSFWTLLAQLESVYATQARVLIYSRTLGFRHDSIPTAIDVLKAKQESINVEFTSTEDPSQFTDSTLSGYDALLFLSTTGEGKVLDADGIASFQKYLNLGGNFVAIHSASDTLRNTTCYTRELGASLPLETSREFSLTSIQGSIFDYHPALQNFTVDVFGPSHPSTSMLPAQWTVQDEAYNFESDPRALGAVVVLSANESSYVDTGVRRFDQGTPHPTAWYQEKGAGIQAGGVAGRSFYTSLGHLNETWQDELFLSHVLGGISWALQSNTTRAFNSSALVGNQENNSTATSTSVGPQPTKSPQAQNNNAPGMATSYVQATIIQKLVDMLPKPFSRPSTAIIAGTLFVVVIGQVAVKLLK
ncbi:hypothetical protein CVT26_005761 [Gymnopilus dilepis]|uniref:ThuA-like domain-containing protein n=1 Tax=Gymnopilus dilepis TaxID=231916 RepID=A0A409VPR9_9AGAR|nr:hypothetical protein CVT26_005761 [Gymnopilus dilepis]